MITFTYPYRRAYTECTLKTTEELLRTRDKSHRLVCDCILSISNVSVFSSTKNSNHCCRWVAMPCLDPNITYTGKVCKTTAHFFVSNKNPGLETPPPLYVYQVFEKPLILVRNCSGYAFLTPWTRSYQSTSSAQNLIVFRIWHRKLIHVLELISCFLINKP